jgi:hypothetical protein
MAFESSAILPIAALALAAAVFIAGGLSIGIVVTLQTLRHL